MSPRGVFHEGEIEVQERAGERAVALRNGTMLSDRIVARARPFLAGQRMVVVAASDPEGQLWASLWFGPPGFVRSEEEGSRVSVTRSPGGVSPDDPVAGHLQPGQSLGLLAIELSSRRRLRINGVLGDSDAATLEVEVREAFPNCPKYIQRRHPAPSLSPAAQTRETGARGETLDAPRRDFVARVDTAFVASAHPTRGLDASHRGGSPGFIRVEGARTLRFPDYPGNSMFQTLGNLAIDPRAGLALLDFARGRVLMLTGTAVASFGAEDPTHPTGGTGRYWTFTVARWIELSLPVDFAWELLDRSPFNPPAGAAP